MSRLTAAASLVAVVSLIGCGGSSNHLSDEDQIRSVVHAAATAIAQRDYVRVCSLLTRRAQTSNAAWPPSYRDKSCPERYRATYAAFPKVLPDLAKRLRRLGVRSVSVQGDSAVARVAIPGSSWRTVYARNIRTSCGDCVSLREEAGIWRIDQWFGR
jgi:hypothetical protein